MNNYKLTKGNSITLDLIRGLSAQLVVVGHGISFFGIFKSLHQPNFPWMQNIAVLIFFILSGFLITYSTLRKKDYRFSHFFADRFSRIYTAFVPSILFVVIADFSIKYLIPSKYYYENAFNFKTFIGNIFMLQDHPLAHSKLHMPDITSFGTARPFWTLAVEWWIYLFFGYLFLVIFKKKFSILSLIIFTFLSIVPIYNFIEGRGNGLTLFWIFGALVYYLASQDILKNMKRNTKLVFLFLVITLAAFRLKITMQEYEAIFAFSLALILLLILDLTKNVSYSRLTTKFIKLIADYSYTLYLVHYSVLSFIVTYFDKTYSSYYLFIFGFIVSNIISFIIGYYAETKLTKKVKSYLYKLIDKNSK